MWCSPPMPAISARPCASAACRATPTTNPRCAALDRLAALEKAGARIVFGHDPEFWATAPQAPALFA
jgi:hypothetical protein